MAYLADLSVQIITNTIKYSTTNFNLKFVEQSAENNDPFTTLLRSDSQKFIAQAVEAELELLLARQ